jgi:hypothetical protein
MKAILIAEGDDRVAELFAYLFARDGWTVTTSSAASARPTRSEAARRTTPCS